MYFSFQIWPIVAALVAVTILTTRYLRLRNIPGPFITSFTDLWRVYQQNYNGPFSEILSQLHKKYGPIVRIGPNTVSVADAGAVETIYTLRGEFPKVRSITLTSKTLFQFVYLTKCHRLGRLLCSFTITGKWPYPREHH